MDYEAVLAQVLEGAAPALPGAGRTGADALCQVWQYPRHVQLHGPDQPGKRFPSVMLNTAVGVPLQFR